MALRAASAVIHQSIVESEAILRAARKLVQEEGR